MRQMQVQHYDIAKTAQWSRRAPHLRLMRCLLSYVAALVILGLVALAACALPARVAMRVEPVEALRLE